MQGSLPPRPRASTWRGWWGSSLSSCGHSWLLLAGVGKGAVLSPAADAAWAESESPELKSKLACPHTAYSSLLSTMGVFLPPSLLSWPSAGCWEMQLGTRQSWVLCWARHLRTEMPGFTLDRASFFFWTELLKGKAHDLSISLCAQHLGQGPAGWLHSVKKTARTQKVKSFLVSSGQVMGIQQP